MQLLASLWAAHLVVDFLVQNDFVARAKNPANPVSGVPWYWPMLAHAVSHGAAVGLLTDSWLLGSIETAAHFGIDYAKCSGWISFDVDQLAHLGIKALYLA